MAHRKEVLLNSLLAAMVLLSVVLSSRIWFPADKLGFPGFGEARVQTPPPDTGEGMPRLFRPQRIYVRQTGNRVALIQAGMPEHQRLWTRLQSLITGVKVVAPSAPLPSIDELDGESITVVLPIPLSLSEWADQWSWTPQGVRAMAARIDRLVLRGGPNPGLYTSGPDGELYRLASLPPEEAKSLQTISQSVEASHFRPYRPLAQLPANIRTTAGVLVPAVQTVPTGTVGIRLPNETAEETRYFPDLSVVRQIDERDARSYTDGQRLLRITTAGVLEYLTVQNPGLAPDLSRTLVATQEFLAAHGGWPSDLILSRVVQERGVTRLHFDLRSTGPFPVETGGGSLRIDVTGNRFDVGSQVVMFRNWPDLKGSFGTDQTRVMPVEEALTKAIEEAPVTFLNERLREIHLAYLFSPRTMPGPTKWVLIPTWVFDVGEMRVLISADLGRNNL